MKKLFIIDDEKAISNALKYAFESEYKVLVANTYNEFNEIIANTKPDVVLLDLRFGDTSGLDLLIKINKLYNNVAVIIMTAYGSIDTSIRAIKEGAYDYILKPLDLEELTKLIKNAIKYTDMQKKLIKKNAVEERYDGVVGKSAAIQKVYQSIKKVKDLNVNVLILGESGTGKELVARQIHYQGNRSAMPLHTVNCAAIPENLLESELFGYEKGAFTGADKPKMGAFEKADKSSIFLDEIGEMSLPCQAKVLRVIQEKEITPLGSNISKSIDVRIIAATNRDLEKEVEEGRFRADLYYRLYVFPIYVPSLQERREDIPDLVESFIAKAHEIYNINVQGITADAMESLKNADYKGNIRELENIIYRACIMAETGNIDKIEIKKDMPHMKEEQGDKKISIAVGTTIENAEKELILGTLNYVNNNKVKAAKILGISERSLYYKLKMYTDNVE